MRTLTTIIFLWASLPCFPQTWHSTCSSEGFLQIEEDGPITRMWVEGAYFNCYGRPDERWHEYNLYCCESAEFETYKIPFGDTLEMLIGNGEVVVAASSKYRKWGLTYGTSCPNVSISGPADVECFERYSEPVQPVTNWYAFDQGCIQPVVDAALVSWPILEPFSVSVADLESGGWTCLEKSTCFYLVSWTGGTTETICF